MSTPSQARATVRLTVAQATIRFLTKQWTERDGERRRLIAGCLGIFGHGNVAGIGQALLEDELSRAGVDGSAAQVSQTGLPYVLARNEQAMVHTAVGYARASDRLSTFVCTASIGPGSTNMLTGAALATINRIPVLLLPSGAFATRVASPVLQQVESPTAGDVAVNDAFRPLCAFYDEVHRPEQLASALLAAMRVLTDPARTGAVTISLPQDVQAQAHDFPTELFTERIWRVPRQRPDLRHLSEAAAMIRRARRPLIVAGGGVHYSGAENALAALADATGIPVAETQAGKGSLLHGHPRLVGAIGSTGTRAANALAREADLVIGVGTRWSDFTTASRTAFQDDGVQFININVAAPDTDKLSGYALLADARETLTELAGELVPWEVLDGYRDEQERLWREWDAQVSAAYHPVDDGRIVQADGLLSQAEVIGIVNEHSGPRDVVVCAAGSMPGDLHRMWRVRDRLGYHVEYGYSCMGYEIPAAIGVKWADPSREVFAMVGDGGYLMMPAELVTAVQERTKIIVVLVQNHGFQSIGGLSESVGSQRFGTRYRERDPGSGRLDGDLIDVDLAANARSLGAYVIVVSSRSELAAAVARARHRPAESGPVVIHVRTDPFVPGPDGGAWWDVPVSEVSALESTRAAYRAYAEHKVSQRPLVSPPTVDGVDRAE